MTNEELNAKYLKIQKNLQEASDSMDWLIKHRYKIWIAQIICIALLLGAVLWVLLA